MHKEQAFGILTKKNCSKEVDECRLENILLWGDSSLAEAHADIAERW